MPRRRCRRQLEPAAVLLGRPDARHAAPGRLHHAADRRHAGRRRARRRDRSQSVRRRATCRPRSRRCSAEAGRRTRGGTDGPELRPDRRRRRPGRLRGGDPRRAAQDEGGAGRARASGRHLPELGLHPDQGAAALGRGAGADAARGELRPRGRQPALRRGGRGQAQPRRGAAAQPRRRPPAEEEQGHGVRRRRPSSPARASSP